MSAHAVGPEPHHSPELWRHVCPERADHGELMLAPAVTPGGKRLAAGTDYTVSNANHEIATNR